MRNTASVEDALKLQEQAINLDKDRDREGALEAIDAAVEILDGIAGVDQVRLAMAHQIAGGLSFGARRWTAAETHYRRAIEILRTIGRENPVDFYPVVLSNLSILYASERRFSEAVPLLLEALEELRKVPQSHGRRANILTTLAGIRSEEGREQDAELLYQNALALWHQARDRSEADIIFTVERQAEFYHRHGHYQRAEEQYRNSLVLREAAFGPDSVAASEGAGHVGRTLLAQNKYDDAERYFLRSIQLGRKNLGDEYPGLGTALNNLAVLYKREGDFGRAEHIYQRALRIHAERYGSPDYVNTLTNLALLYEAAQRLPDAEAGHKEILAILSQVLQPTADIYFQALNRLATIYEKTERPVEAETALQELVEINKHRIYAPASEGLELSIRLEAIRRKSGRTDSLEGLDDRIELLTKSIELNRKSVKEHAAGRYRSAFDLSCEYLDKLEAAVGREHPYVVVALSNLGVLAHEIGDYRAAEQYYRRAMGVAQRAYAVDNPGWGALLNNVGEFHRAKGDFAGAREFYERARSARQRNPGPHSAEFADTLNSLASLLKDTNEFAGAEVLYRQALEISESARDERGTRIITANLGFVAMLRERYGDAEPLLRRALGLAESELGKNHLDVALLQENVAAIEEQKGHLETAEELLNRALSSKRESLGEEHPLVGDALRKLAKLNAIMGRPREGIPLFREQIAIEDKQLTQLLIGGSERDRQLVAGRLAATTAEIVSFHAQVLPNDSGALRLAFETVLKRKGRVLDAMADSFAHLRRRSSPEDQALFARFMDVSAQLAILGERGPLETVAGAYPHHIALLEKERAKLETAVAERSAEFRADLTPINLEAARDALPEGSALVELFQYRPKSGWGMSESERRGEARYVAYVLRCTGELGWRDLGEAQSLDRALWELRAALSEPSRANDRPLAAAVEERVMRSLRNLLGDATAVLLSPDGVLNLIPFTALVDEARRYLLQCFSFTYLSSGRDLIRLQLPRQSRSPPVVVASPNYYLRGHDVSRRRWLPLPHTLGEAETISELLPDTRLLIGSEATESAQRELAGPRVLHVATHGYFEPQVGAAVSENPLSRSGLVLAGANGRYEGDDDGLFSALEVAGLDLWGTCLAVLSACETGLGEVLNGEGVYGLRRALVLAGAESQLISLWNVSSKDTRELMRGYYGQLSKGVGRSEALRAVQRAMAADPKTSHPYYWAPFIVSGAWGPLPG